MSGAATAVEVVLLLLAVGALAYFGIVARARGPVESTALRLVGRLSLEPRKAIYLVKVADTVVVVGASEQGLVKLAEVDAAKIPEPPAPRRASLRDLLGGGS